MALEATHCRFAIAVASSPISAHLKPELFAGAVYPDSRYLTRVSREFTHAAAPQPSPGLPLSPFEQGWASHLAYDHLASPAYRMFLPHPTASIQPLSQEWLIITAAKIVEDRLSYHALDALPAFHTLPTPAARPGEDQELLTKYYTLLKNFYAEARELQDYLLILHDFGIPSDFAERVIMTAETFERNPSIHKQIKDIFVQVLSTYQSQR